MSIPTTIKENEVLLVLKNSEDNQELYTIIGDNEEIVLWSIGSDFVNEETVAYAFESNVEIGRVSSEDKELLSDVVTDWWNGYILRNNDDIEEYLNGEMA
jgi:hypothetical protein